MSKYVIVTKENNSIKTLLDMEGSYLIDNSSVVSKTVHPNLVLDFDNFNYFYDESVEGNIRSEPKERNSTTYEVY